MTAPEMPKWDPDTKYNQGEDCYYSDLSPWEIVRVKKRIRGGELYLIEFGDGWHLETSPCQMRKFAVMEPWLKAYDEWAEEFLKEKNE